MAKPWVRLYRDAINNLKVGRLTLEERGFWMTLLMISDDDGLLPEDDDLAWKARVTECETDAMVQVMLRHGLVTRDVTNGSRLRLHDWDQHQHASDADPTARERKQRQREREKSQKYAVTRDVTVGHANVTRTDTDTDTDTDTEAEKKEAEAREQVRAHAQPDPEPVFKTKKPRTETPRGTRWPPDAVVPEDWLAEGEAYREMGNLPPLDLRAEALKFANYWAAKSGGNATKIDWKRTWINWCLTAKGTANGYGKSEQKSLASEVFGGLYAEARAAREASGN